MCKHRDDLLPILRLLCDIFFGFFLFFFGQFVRASAFFMVIASCKATRFPRIKPMGECQTFSSKKVQKCMESLARKTEKHIMRTLPDTMMATLLLASAEYMLCCKTQIVHASHRSSAPLRTVCKRAAV